MSGDFGLTEQRLNCLLTPLRELLNKAVFDFPSYYQHVEWKFIDPNGETTTVDAKGWFEPEPTNN